MFNHLLHVDKGYFEHMYHAMHFCALSARAAFYFFFHGLYPDVFVSSGSQQIQELADLLEKMKTSKTY
jgi:hypothetical protein